MFYIDFNYIFSVTQVSLVISYQLTVPKEREFTDISKSDAAPYSFNNWSIENKFKIMNIYNCHFSSISKLINV